MKSLLQLHNQKKKTKKSFVELKNFGFCLYVFTEDTTQANCIINNKKFQQTISLCKDSFPSVAIQTYIDNEQGVYYNCVRIDFIFKQTDAEYCAQVYEIFTASFLHSTIDFLLENQFAYEYKLFSDSKRYIVLKNIDAQNNTFIKKLSLNFGMEDPVFLLKSKFDLLQGLYQIHKLNKNIPHEMKKIRTQIYDIRFNQFKKIDYKGSFENYMTSINEYSYVNNETVC